MWKKIYSVYWALFLQWTGHPGAIQWYTEVNKSQAAPYESDLGDLSSYPQFYPLQITLIAPPDLLLGDTPSILLFLWGIVSGRKVGILGSA